jgi:general secretion pathway protein J
MTRHTRSRHGFTLVELIIALSIVGALLVVAFGGLRVAIGAWRRGDERVETQQHIRSLSFTLARAVSASYPYLAPLQEGETPAVLFKGSAQQLEFVTLISPFPTSVPVAFTAIVIELVSSGDRPKLVIRQRVLPNRNPFKDASTVLEDDSIKALELSYLGTGGWQSDWDPQGEGALPRAIRIALNTTAATDQRPPQALTVTIGTPKR